jgi:hypothetical protein
MTSPKHEAGPAIADPGLHAGAYAGWAFRAAVPGAGTVWATRSVRAARSDGRAAHAAVRAAGPGGDVPEGDT